MKKIGRHIIIFLIIGEFLLTGMGFCGHYLSHTHSRTFHINADADAINSTQHAHSHSGDHSGKETSPCHKVHCSCLGNFLAEEVEIVITPFVKISKLINETSYQHLYFVPKRLYRPPINSI